MKFLRTLAGRKGKCEINPIRPSLRSSNGNAATSICVKTAQNIPISLSLMHLTKTTKGRDQIRMV
jgi:hypothetical protein